MLVFRTPTPDLLRRFLARQSSVAFSYSEVGATEDDLPRGYRINHTRRHLGHGRDAFNAACNALRSWHQLRLGWVDCWPHDTPLVPGAEIVVIGRALGLYWLNACRIAYLIDERSDHCGTTSHRTESERFGYAHGTLPEHLAIGEERFLIEMDTVGRVSLDILSFSKPNTLLAKLGYPLIRRSQLRFLSESANQVERLVNMQLHLATPTVNSRREMALFD